MDVNTARKLGEEVQRVDEAAVHLLTQCREQGASDADVIDAAETYCAAINARNAAFDACTGAVGLGERRIGEVDASEWLPGELEAIVNNGQLDGAITARVDQVLGEGKSAGGGDGATS